MSSEPPLLRKRCHLCIRFRMGGLLCPSLFGHGLRLAQREHRAARVGEHAIDGAVAGQVLEGQAVRGAEHDQAGMALRRQSQNLDGWIAVSDDRLDGGAAAGARFLGEDAQFEHGRSSPCRWACLCAPSPSMGGSTWSRISFAFWVAAIWQASAALGREVSRSVVACRTTRSSPLATGR